MRRAAVRPDVQKDPQSPREVFGTGIIGGLLSYPIAVAFMGVEAGSIAFYAYVVPFLVSTVGGSVLAGILVFSLERSGAMKSMRAAI